MRIDGLDVLLRDVRVDVADSDLAAFQAWLRQHGSGFFNFTDWVDGVTRDTRIAGGRVTLTRGVGRIEGGSRFMTARVVLESV